MRRAWSFDCSWHPASGFSFLADISETIKSAICGELGLLTAADTQPPVGRGAAKQDPRLWLVDQDPASSLVGSRVGADWEKERSSLSTEICWEGKTFITLALVAKSCFDFSSLKVSRAWCILLQILLIFYFLRVGSCKTGKMADVFFPEGRQGCQAGKVRLKLWILSPPALLQSKFQTLSKNKKLMQMEKKLQGVTST